MDADRLRAELRAADLDEHSVAADPIAQFERWFADARAAGAAQPEAMTLATADASGRPAARMVLLRGLDARGFAFYTNLESAKAHDLQANPRAALVFHWVEVNRQVRVEGTVSALPAEEADAYFASRPRGSQVGAWSSPQSRPLPGGRAELDTLLTATERRFAHDTALPRPPFWSGFVVAPATVELWQGRDARLHDRVRYTRAGARWTVERLAP